jgi:monoamine oxidase
VTRLNHDVSVAQSNTEANAKRIEERNAQLLDVEKQKAQLHAQIAKATDERALLKARWNELARQVSDVRRLLEPLTTLANSIYDTEAIERLKLAMKNIRVRTTGSGSMKYRHTARRLRSRDRDDKFSGSHTRRDAMDPIDEERLVQDENEACTAANMVQNDLSSGEEACAMLQPFLVTDQQRVNYLQARNTVLLEWHKNPSVQLLLDDIAADVLDEHLPVLEAAYSYLNRYGVINVGVYARKREPARKEGERIVVIGAGWAGLTVARQLRSFGYDVVVLEGRDEVGGRCRSDTSFDVVGNGGAVDLGASIVTGTEGNPLTWLIRQLKVPTHLIRNECPQHSADGRAIDEEFDNVVASRWDGLLDFVSTEVKNKPGSEEASLGGTMRRALRDSGLDAVQERQLWWYWSNLEYACASNLDNVSLNYWDQDDEWMLEGDHLLLERGFASLLKPLAQGTDVRFGQVVERVELRGDGVRVHVRGADAPLVATRCVLTPSLGVLKSGALTFEPPLPARKVDAINRLGFGVLNKVVLLFDEVFWSNRTDYFGYSSGEEATRGWYYIFWNLCLAMKSPVLIALVTGDAAEQVEARDEREVVADVVGVLRRIYGAERVRDPLRSTVTKWRSDPFALGSYSYIAVGATGADIDALAEPVENRLFFAGEATSRTHPATTTGAMMTGLAQAGLIDEIVCNSKVKHANKN